jgi:hypothetical protein
MLDGVIGKWLTVRERAEYGMTVARQRETFTGPDSLFIVFHRIGDVPFC